MDEFAFIDSIKQRSYKQSSLLKGIGDDAAVFRQTSEDIVTAVDTFVEGVHFSRDTMQPFHIGYRALAANISDLAAMGATPAFFLTSIVKPESWHVQEVEEVFIGMKELANSYGMDLIGGDTVSGKELTISITVIGYVPGGRARYRSVAQKDDIVFVTGTLGDSRAGLHLLTENNLYEHTEFFIQRHRTPTPRVEFAKSLINISRIALNDISDGIANEAAEIAEASNVGMLLYDESIPTSSFFTQFSMKQQHEWKYFGGEDFELMGTVSRQDWPSVKQAAEKTNTNLSEIGIVTEKNKNSNVFIMKDNIKQGLNKCGYTHFR
ncbi:thiamine-phosphate kinase [Virgibacillus halodenitrificans]|uniref:Thiamine-monophosphate kinase n=1 Tax=Virgibacillus halodenitrificans TaxID=1482 RepID=A0ABR7VVS3_VIRHA|nr:thiamine-phosphate kinase [Virgibacillus halodenitrificans]MBD1224647.1 thiamine-phosphate kinase [Virgibacillus halodenitrificans]